MEAAWQIYHVRQVRPTEHMTEVITLLNCNEDSSQDFHAFQKLHKLVLKKVQADSCSFLCHIFLYVFRDVAFVCIAVIHCLITHKIFL